MKTHPIRFACSLVVLIFTAQLSSSAQEQPIDRQLRHVEVDARMESFRQATTELLQIRKQLVFASNNAEREELEHNIQKFEHWRDILRNEIHELAAERPPGGPHDSHASNDGGAPHHMAQPHGRYQMELNFEPRGGERVHADFMIEGDHIECIAASDDRYVGMAGTVKPTGDHRFLVRMRNEDYVASQIWAPADSGRWRVLEIPDRGENQIAEPVPQDHVHEQHSAHGH